MLLRNATVLTMDPAVPDLQHGDVLVDGPVIADVGTDLRHRLPVGDSEFDASGCIVVPGFVDTHRHMWEGLFRGIAPRATLNDYFERVVFGLGPRLTPDDLALSETLSAVASLDAGITTVQDTSDINDAPERTDAIVAALQNSGLRAVFAYGLPRPFVDRRGASLPDDVHRVRREMLWDDSALVTMALSTPNGDDEGERRNAELATELNLRTAHHVRETITPSRLRTLGALRPGTTFVHGNNLDAAELRIMSDAGGSLSIAPFVEMAMRMGKPMIIEALATAGLNVCLSVDVEVTSPTDMFTQMRLAYLTGRLAPDDGGPTVRDVLSMATINGAQALGLHRRTGSISPGKRADLLILRSDSPTAVPVADPYSTVVLQMDRGNVDTVLVDGIMHKHQGQLVQDHTRAFAGADRVLSRLNHQP